MKVAVLGGGHGAYATAADLALAGHGVRLWRRREEDLATIRGAGGITLVAEGRRGKAVLERVTAELADAVAGAEVVIVPLPATAHHDVAGRLAKVLEAQQIVLLTPGLFGSYVVAREIVRAGGRLPFAFAETGTLPYLARKTGPAAVAAPVRAAHLPAGVFPAARASETLDRLRTLFAALRPCHDALDAALTSAGPVIHPALLLLNAGAIEAGRRLDIHASGTTPRARRLIDAVDGERMAIRANLECPPPHYELSTYYDESRAADGLYGAGAKDRLLASRLWEEDVTFEHRYVTESAALGLSLFESAGRLAAVDTPVVSGLLSVFGALLGRDLRATGRGLDRLGLGDFVRREIRALLHDGWLSPLWRRAVAG
jgi:opine dehydrogenase